VTIYFLIFDDIAFDTRIKEETNFIISYW